MPGIMPMKVIRVGQQTQSRIAQACDRCRSKKIRCDGVRPCCSQCSSVGFECRTSDKLSRRAFPRGYTESLEERVRQLETEVKELKDLLDEKDEKIDLLSKMHDYRPSPTRTVSAEPQNEAPAAPQGDAFREQISPQLVDSANSDGYFVGSSSGRNFLGALKRKMQESGKLCPKFNPEQLLHSTGRPCPPLDAPKSLIAPPRLFTDRCVQVYLQEWAPLFPVIHRPTFLPRYDEFLANPDKIQDHHQLAQLYLVFSIAAFSSSHPDMDHIATCEAQWQRSMEAIVMGNSMETLQCLVLAIMYCTIRADHERLQHYKSIAVGLTQRLGLHQSQKRFSFGALTIETRKKVFWTLYTLDCFSAAMLGLPKMMKDQDVHTEYPSDADDECVTEKGFQPMLPGETTKMSNALAFFKAARILSRTLDNIYPTSTSHKISLQQMSSLDAELSQWNENLPSHLKLNFSQDKPSTDVTGSRSPLLSLAYHYTRMLIHRPAIGSSLGTKSAPALITVGGSSKHILQIIELLEERNLSFSFCLQKTDLLVLCATTFLYQSLDLKNESKILKDSERLAKRTIAILERQDSSRVADLKKAAALLFPADQSQRKKQSSRSPTVGKASSSPVNPTVPQHSVPEVPSSIGRQAGASCSESDLLAHQQARIRRMTMPNSLITRPNLHGSPMNSSAELGSNDYAQGSRRDARSSLGWFQQKMTKLSNKQKAKPNLDYLPLGDYQAASYSSPSEQNRNVPTSQPMSQEQQMYPSGDLLSKSYGNLNGDRPTTVSEWEALVGAMDNGPIYDAIYGGPSASHGINDTPSTMPDDFYKWPADAGACDLPNFNLDDQISNLPMTARSVPSISDESLSSGDDAGTGEFFFMGNEELQAYLPQPTPQDHHHQQHVGQIQQPRTSYDGDDAGVLLNGLDLNMGVYK